VRVRYDFHFRSGRSNARNNVVTMTMIETLRGTGMRGLESEIESILTTRSRQPENALRNVRSASWTNEALRRLR